MNGNMCDETCDCHSYNSGYIAELMPTLQQGLWHRTNKAGFTGIWESGFIEPSTGKHKYTYSKTPFFYGGRNGYVCLFDFETTEENDYRCNWTNWGSFFCDQSPFTVCLRLDRKQLPLLIPRSSAADNDYGYFGWVECWYPKPISIEAVDRVLVTQLNPEGTSIIIRGDFLIGQDEGKIACENNSCI